VGTSFTYKKSVESTRTTTGSTQDISTEVEVSTVFDGLILGVITVVIGLFLYHPSRNGHPPVTAPPPAEKTAP